MASPTGNVGPATVDDVLLTDVMKYCETEEGYVFGNFERFVWFYDMLPSNKKDVFIYRTFLWMRGVANDEKTTRFVMENLEVHIAPKNLLGSLVIAQTALHHLDDLNVEDQKRHINNLQLLINELVRSCNNTCLDR